MNNPDLKNMAIVQEIIRDCRKYKMLNFLVPVYEELYDEIFNANIRVKHNHAWEPFPAKHNNKPTNT